MGKQEVCLLLDYENIHISMERAFGASPDVHVLVQAIKKHFSQYGNIIIGKAYGDWELFMGIPAQLQREQIEPVYIGAKRYLGRDSAIRPGVAKNAADIQLALDALEIVHDKPNIENYILISGDYDFVPLVMKLHKHSKRVCLAGIQASTSRDLRDLVGDDFVTIDELLGIQALDVPKIDTVDWYALVKLLVGWESGSMEFVGKKLFARQLPPSIVGKYDTPEGRPMIVGEAIAAGIIEVYYVPNPKSPGTSTAAIRVNREHIFVKKVLSGGQ